MHFGDLCKCSVPHLKCWCICTSGLCNYELFLFTQKNHGIFSFTQKIMDFFFFTQKIMNFCVLIKGLLSAFHMLVDLIYSRCCLLRHFFFSLVLFSFFWPVSSSDRLLCMCQDQIVAFDVLGLNIYIFAYLIRQCLALTEL